MRLFRSERDWYVTTITRNPALTGTEQASFDNGETWIDGHATTYDGDPAVGWLLAGPDFDAAAVGEDDADTDATITTDVLVQHRLADDPVLDVETGPRIRLV